MSHERIGGGFFFKVYSGPECNKVIKVAKYGRSSRGKYGDAFRLRMRHDISLIQGRLQKHIVPSQVKTFKEYWVVVQPKVNNVITLNSSTVQPELRTQALKIIQDSQIIDNETGFAFDFIGSESFKLILKYLFTNYWALPGLLVNNHKIETLDHNLIWSGRNTKYLKEKIKTGEIKKEALIPVIEPLTYFVGQLCLWYLKRKMINQKLPSDLK